MIQNAVAEPILEEDKSRFVLFPIKHDDIWQMYKQHEASFWTSEEIDLSQDKKDWDCLLYPSDYYSRRLYTWFAKQSALPGHVWSTGLGAYSPGRSIQCPDLAVGLRLPSGANCRL